MFLILFGATARTLEIPLTQMKGDCPRIVGRIPCCLLVCGSSGGLFSAPPGERGTGGDAAATKPPE